MDTFDKFLSRKISNDNINFDIDNTRFNYLHYMVSLNSAKSDVKKNSMIGFLSSFLSPRFIVVKIVFVSILLIVMIGNNQNKRFNNSNLQCDSTFTQKNSPLDTLITYIQYNDSIYN